MSEKIDWEQKAQEFGLETKEQIISWAYEKERTYDRAAGLLSERGRNISRASFKKAMHEIGHEVYLKKGQTLRKRSPESIKRKYESRMSVSRELAKQNAPAEWNYKCWCGAKCPYPRRYTCTPSHMEILESRKAYMVDLEITGNYRKGVHARMS